MTEGEPHVPAGTRGMDFHRFWSAYLDALERHLDRMDQSRPAKKKDSKKTARRKPRVNRGETK